VGGGACVDRGVVRHGENVASKRNGALWAPFLRGRWWFEVPIGLEGLRL
jgi:hypothetical protein